MICKKIKGKQMKKKEMYDTYELIENLKNNTLNDLMFASLRGKALNDDKYLKKFKFVRLKVWRMKKYFYQ